MCRSRSKVLLLAVTSLGGSFAASALAQTVPAAGGVLEEVIVTAEKRETTLQNVAVSVTAVRGADLAAQGRTAFNDALRSVPSVVVRDENGSEQPSVAIRGIQKAFETDPSININIDGVYQATGVMPVYDVARIEVLKGPQGTLYGRNALGGVVNIVTNGPSNEFGGNVLVRYGNYNAARIEAAVNLPLSERVQSRTATVYSVRDGYLSNGSMDEDVRAVREKLRFEITDDFSALLTGEYVRIGGHGAGTVPGPLSGSTSVASFPGFTTQGAVLVPVLNIPRPSDPWYSEVRPGAQELKKQAASLQLDWNLPWSKLFVLAAYEDVHALNDNNVQTLAELNSVNEDRSYNSAYELRFSNPDTSPVIWQAGLYFSNEISRLPLFPEVLLPLEQHVASPPFTPTAQSVIDTDDTSRAAFAQLTFPVTDALRLTGGVRYTREKQDRTITVYDVTYTDLYTTAATVVGISTASPVRNDTGENAAWTGKLGIEYDLGPDSLLYADYARGFKAGGLNSPDVPATVAPSTYKPEYLDAYEIGSKNEFFDNTLRVNVDAYYYKNKDKQYVLVGACNPFAQYGVACPLPQTPTVNASSASMYGLELQSAWLVTPDDQIELNVAWNHTRFDEFLQTTSPGPGLPNGYPLGTFTDPVTGHTTPVVACGGTITCFDRSGDQLPNAPEWTETISYQHTFRFGAANLTVAGNAQFVSKTDTDVNIANNNGLDQHQPSYEMYGARVEYGPVDGPWTLGAYGNNLSNEAVRVRSFVGNRLWLMPPRTYGVTLNVRF